MTSYIYFIQAHGDGPIKIGFTADDPRKRMVKIQSDCPWPVTLLGTIEGSLSLEKQLHLLLARWRTQGEWFQPHPIVLASVNEALKVGRRPPAIKKSRQPKYQHELCRYRADNGLTLQKVADRVGITHASLSRIESGRQLPSWALACRLAKATGLHVKAFRPETYHLLFGAEASQ